jgi:chromosome segregation ATPase
MNIQEQIAFFLSKFKKLKSQINNAPRNLSWISNERKEIQELCNELEGNYNSIAKYLAAKNSRHTFISVLFENDLKEYENYYRKFVLDAAEPAKERSRKEFQDSLKSAEEIWIQAGKTKDEFWKSIDEWTEKASPLGSAFDPLTDDPAAVVQSAFDVLWIILDAFAKSIYHLNC